MPTNIGQWALQLTANPLGFTAGLKVAETALASFTNKIQQMTGAEMSKGIKAGANAFASNFGQALESPLQFMAAKLKQIPRIGELLALPVEAASTIGAFYTVSAARIKNLGMEAAKLGISMNDFSTLMINAGPDTEGTTKALFKLSQVIGDAQMGSDEASKKLRSLGLTIRDLEGKSAVQQFGLIGDRLNSLGNVAVKNKIAFDLFGKSGREAILALSKGSAGLSNASALRDKLGLSVDESDLAAIRMAGQAAKTIQMAKTGFGNQVAIGLAPYLAALTESFGQATGGANMFGSVLDVTGGKVSGVAQATMFGAKIIAYSFATVYETGRMIGTLWDVFQIGALGAGSAIVDAMSLGLDAVNILAKSIASVLSLLAKVPGAQTALGIDKSRMEDISKNGLSGINDAKGFLDNGNANAKKRADDLWQGIGAGAGDNAFRGVGRWLDGVDKKMQEMRDNAKRNPLTGDSDIWATYGERARTALEALSGPLGKFQDQLRKLDELWMANQKAPGLFPVDAYFQSLTQGFADLASKSDALQPPKRPAALEQGSTAAYSAILTATQNPQNMPIQQQIKAVLDEQARKQEVQIRTGYEIAATLKALGVRGI